MGSVFSYQSQSGNVTNDSESSSEYETDEGDEFFENKTNLVNINQTMATGKLFLIIT